VAALEDRIEHLNHLVYLLFNEVGISFPSYRLEEDEAWANKMYDLELHASAEEMEARQPEPDPTCNFCGKEEKEVKRLISGPNCYICDVCVATCKDIIEEER
jgi:hypothetical protein